jgi:hypothetical protein
MKLLFTATFTTIKEIVVMKMVQKARAPTSLVILSTTF